MREPARDDVDDWASARALYEAQAEAQDGWEAPIAFDSVELPAFPMAALPPWLHTFVAELAIATQTPPDLGGMLALAVCAAALAKRVRVCVKDGWHEPVNLYIVVALPPASRKSTVFSEVTAPFAEHERRERDRLRPEIEAAQAQRRIIECALRHATERAARARGAAREAAEREAKEHAAALAELRIPIEPRLITSDVTPEKLVTVLAEQDGRNAVLSSEGGVFEIMAGRYAKDPNFDVMLKAHAGDDLRVDRLNRPSEYVHAPALTLGLTVQPDVVHALARKPGFRGRGLLGRILYALPHSGIGTRLIDAPPLSDAARQEYHRRLAALLVLQPDRGDDGRPREHIIKLSDGARAELRAFEEWIEPRLAETGELGTMGDWAGKLAGAIARIAGVLHVTAIAGHARPWERPIARETMVHAVALGRYLIPHAQAAYRLMDDDPLLGEARQLLAWIERERIERFARREALRARRRLPVALLQKVLAILVERHFIREAAPATANGIGRKPGPAFEVNPRVHGQMGQNGQNGSVR